MTRRFVDPGALIQAGTASATQSLPIVRISDNYRLRLDFPVSVSNVKDIQLGEPVEIKVESLDNRSFSGKITRFTHNIDEATRTMLTEIEVPNPQLELVPGMYARVSLKVGRHDNALTIPTKQSPPTASRLFMLSTRRTKLNRVPLSWGWKHPLVMKS